MPDVSLADDLLKAARFLMQDGVSLDTDEAVRIGMVLAEHAAYLRARDGNPKGEDGTAPGVA